MASWHVGHSWRIDDDGGLPCRHEQVVALEGTCDPSQETMPFVRRVIGPWQPVDHGRLQVSLFCSVLESRRRVRSREAKPHEGRTYAMPRKGGPCVHAPALLAIIQPTDLTVRVLYAIALARFIAQLLGPGPTVTPCFLRRRLLPCIAATRLRLAVIGSLDRYRSGDLLWVRTISRVLERQYGVMGSWPMRRRGEVRRLGAPELRPGPRVSRSFFGSRSPTYLVPLSREVTREHWPPLSFGARRA